MKSISIRQVCPNAQVGGQEALVSKAPQSNNTSKGDACPWSLDAMLTTHYTFEGVALDDIGCANGSCFGSFFAWAVKYP